jgi:hypothetical protein
VAIGPADPAGVGSALAAGLRARGHEVQVVVWVESPWGYRADRAVGTGRGAARFALGTARRCDVLHVLGGRSWLGYIDLLLARRRTTLIQYNGGDCRTSDIARRLHPARARIVDPGRDREIRLHRRLGARAACAAVVQDLELVDYLRGTWARIYVAPFAIELAAIEVAAAPARDSEPGGRLRVLHAPSDRRIKGSDAIEAAVAEAAREAELELETVVGRHDDVIGRIARADIVIDQLNAETPGVLSAEAMALGKVVLCEYDPAKLADFARPCPVVPATRETLARRLVDLAGDAPRRAELGEAGRGYARRVHGHERAAAAAERIYEHARDAEPGVYEATAEGLRRL